MHLIAIASPRRKSIHPTGVIRPLGSDLRSQLCGPADEPRQRRRSDGSARRWMRVRSRTLIIPETARRIARDRSVSRVTTAGESESLDVGRATRTISAVTRTALIIQDPAAGPPAVIVRTADATPIMSSTGQTPTPTTSSSYGAATVEPSTEKASEYRFRNDLRAGSWRIGQPPVDDCSI